MTYGKKVFIVGPGFIGWSVLDELVKENYTITGLVRRQSYADQIETSGAETVLGDLNDKPLLTKYAAAHDIIIHTATADHLPSVEAVLDAIQQRAEQDLHTIFIHTSGVCVVDDKAKGNHKSDNVYSDSVASKINSVPNDAPHRQVDLAILRAQTQLGEKAKIAIMIPPTIYGLNPKHGRLSAQIPTLIRSALKHGYSGHVGTGLNVSSNVHVSDLARGYVALLHHLESTPANNPNILKNPYYFYEASEENEPSFKDIAVIIGAELHRSKLISDPNPRAFPPETYGDLFSHFTDAMLGLSSRCRAVRLRRLGWNPVEKSWKQSLIQDELPFILNENVDRLAFKGYLGNIPSS
ncbi:NAD(P)-binding protein [Hypoxylon trugodes]|uniref:NAD(P)-binding protein n=1 Tax=Hypoxylon trugodes TaxID=326681 RepID=UPI00219B07D6|nr:NAD(P)-binding protein [Hypoxylon trugodes]KAI1389298.1 NAD(P)-binding protein [Hypoxylon trugodes]